MYFDLNCMINTSCKCCTCHASTSPQLVIGACGDELEKHVARFSCFVKFQKLAFHLLKSKLSLKVSVITQKSYLLTCILNSTAPV